MNSVRRLAVNDLASVDVRNSVASLSKLSIAKGLWPLAFDWLVIGACMFLGYRWNSPWAYAPLAFIIACRQHALLVVVHEAAHYRLSNHHGWNDLISEAFAAFPIFFCTEGYRANHHKHHRHLNTMQDPDWARKIPEPEWQFPKNKTQLALTFVKIALTSWYKLLILFYRLSGIGSRLTYASPKGRRLLLKKILFYAVATAFIYQLGVASLVFYYWVIPYLVIFPVIERVRSISEHFALPYSSEHSQTRNILCSPLEAFVFGPHNIRYHLAHHLYPSVPQYNLPALREVLLQDPEFFNNAHENDAYLFFGKKSVLSDITEKS